MSVLLVNCLLMLLALLTPTSAAGNTSQPAATAAYDRVAACFNERRHLVVLGLVDESTSLRSTDPGARRVDALVGMLRMLTRYGKTVEAGKTGTIEVMLAGFGTGYNGGEWTTLNEATAADLEHKAREFAGRNANNDTDFAAALLGAQEELVTKDRAVTATGERQPCRLLLLFTDGKYELGSTSAERPYAQGIAKSNLAAIEDRGRHVLCDPGQLADQLRATGTVIVAIGLVSNSSGARDQTFLQSIAEQSAPGRTCGESTATPGRYTAATGLDQLLTVFDQAIALALNGTPLPPDGQVPVCAATGPADSSCERIFQLDPALREFHMLLNLGAAGIEAILSAPNGHQARMHTGQQDTLSVAGAQLATSRLAELDLVVDGSLPATSTEWVGTWTVRFVDTTGGNASALARSQIIVFGALVPVTEPAPPPFQVGEQTEFTIKIVDSAGSPRTPANFVREATVSAVMVDPTGGQTPVAIGPARADGSYAARYRFPDDASATYADLRVTLNVVTGSGLRLQPRTTTYRVPVRQPSAYPVVSPLELLLTPIINTGPATGTITITGGPGGSGCVWFDRAEFPSTPRNSGAFTTRFEPDATSERNCVRVAPRQQTRVTIEVAPEHVRSGLADGTVSVILAADDQPTRRVVIPVRFELQHPVSPITVSALFAVIVTIGVLLPLLLLWLLSWMTARFVDPRRLRWAKYEVEVTRDGVALASTGHSIRDAVDQSAFLAMADVPAGRARRFACESLTFRRRIPVLPWTLPYALVGAGGMAVLSSGGPGRRDLSAARVAFELNKTWVFVVERNLAGDDEDVRVRGWLYLFLSDFSLAQKVAALMVAVEQELPAIVQAEAGRIRAATASDDEPEDPGTPDPTDIYRPPTAPSRPLP